MLTLARGSPPERRKSRAVLSRRDPSIESLVLGLGVEGVNLDDLRAFGKKLWRDRNSFDVARRRGGLFGSRRLSRDEASALLSSALAALGTGETW